MNPYQQFVSEFTRAVAQAKSYPLGKFTPPPKADIAPGAPRVLLFAPHPDDECIIGGIAVRLLRQAHLNVTNVAVTLGSNRERQLPRLQELQQACAYLGFGLRTTSPTGLERINPRTRQQDPAHWSACVQVIIRILNENRPRVVICPHELDWNSTHMGTHFLVLDALKQMPGAFECFLVESEFWGQMSDPNLMVEISSNDLADMIAALTFHVGELARNPYHLSLPAWMMDNVRRGGEVVGGQGGTAPDFAFATLYRVRKWAKGKAELFYQGGKIIQATADVATLFG